MGYKIAFLFLTINNPNFTKVWDYYFKDHQDKINIYIHPKYPENITWHSENIIKNLKPTAWGYIVDAYKQLFKTAIKNKENIKFITISESCLPIKPFNILYDFAMKNKKESFIKLNIMKKYDYEFRLPPNIKQIIGEKNLIKHYARMCLSRFHIKELLRNESKLDLFIKMHVGDEFFLSSITPLTHFKNIAITFDDWDYINKEVNNLNKKIKQLYQEQERDNKINNNEKIIKLQNIKKDIAKNPKNIIIVSSDDIYNIEHCDSYFYRKFDKNSDIEKYIYKYI